MSLIYWTSTESLPRQGNWSILTGEIEGEEGVQVAESDLALMAHLMRRAGFGATRDELEARVARGYEATVEELLHPETQPDVDLFLMERYLPEYGEMAAIIGTQQAWVYRMINTHRPFQEKMALFWSGVLCTGFSKVDNSRQMTLYIDMLRQRGLGNYRDLLLEVSKHPTMVYFLDNADNHKAALNENYGRELLELFSLGVGMDGQNNYTEDDVKAASRAFTGWNVEPTMPIFPYGRSTWQFSFDITDHDTSEKTFLGEKGHWNGEDVIGIIVRQPATARFICRHLYNFFVADEPPVPNWKRVPPRDMEALETLEKAFVENNYEMLPVLRTLFNSDFFKNARWEKVKSPADVVIGTMRLVGDHTEVKPGLQPIMHTCTYLGQELLNPPTVEGWHTGAEWINTGTLVERINYVAEQVGDLNLPGVKKIVERMSAAITPISLEDFVSGCLDLLGPVEVGEETLGTLTEYARTQCELRRATGEERERFAQSVAEMLQLIAATPEFQYA